MSTKLWCFSSFKTNVCKWQRNIVNGDYSGENVCVWAWYFINSIVKKQQQKTKQKNPPPPPPQQQQQQQPHFMIRISNFPQHIIIWVSILRNFWSIYSIMLTLGRQSQNMETMKQSFSEQDKRQFGFLC